MRPENKSTQSKWLRVVLLIILAYEGLGGLAGGIMLTMAPDGHMMEMPVELMHGTFADFFIPGVILTCLGALNLWAFFSVLRRSGSDWFMACLAMGGYVIWFWIEIAILLELHWLHAMWGLPVVLGAFGAVSLVPDRYEWLRKTGLICGIIASVLYVAINIVIPLSWPEYDIASQTVSELSAIDAPTRFLWIVLSFPYSLLMLAFAAGIVRTAKENRHLLMAGKLLIVYSATGPLWYFAPMHLREVLAAGGGTLSDTMHFVFAAISQLIFLFALYLSSKGLGRSFRWYSLATFITLMLFGTLTFIDAPGVSANTPTPYIGIWERINVGVFMLWVIVLGVTLLQTKYERDNWMGRAAYYG